MKESESMQAKCFTERKKLYEINHPYYCEEGSYYSSGGIDRWGAPVSYSSIKEYLAEWGHEDTDPDFNFIFRWDWKRYKNDEGIVTRSEVLIFYMMQRKGCKKVITITNPDIKDEPLLYAHFKKSWEHMKKTWEGVSDA